MRFIEAPYQNWIGRPRHVTATAGPIVLPVTPAMITQVDSTTAGAGAIDIKVEATGAVAGVDPVYWVLYDPADGVPDAGQVTTGLDATDTSAPASGSYAFGDTASATLSVDPRPYAVAVVIDNGALSNVATSATFTVPAPATSGGITYIGKGQLGGNTNIVPLDLTAASEGDTLYVVMTNTPYKTLSLDLEGEVQNSIKVNAGTGKFDLWAVPINAVAAGNVAAGLFQIRDNSGHRPFVSCFIAQGSGLSAHVIERGNAAPNVISTTVSDGYAIAAGFDFQGVNPQFSGDIGSNVDTPIHDGNATFNFAAAPTSAGAFHSTWTGDPASLVEQSLFLLT